MSLRRRRLTLLWRIDVGSPHPSADAGNDRGQGFDRFDRDCRHIRFSVIKFFSVEFFDGQAVKKDRCKHIAVCFDLDICFAKRFAEQFSGRDASKIPTPIRAPLMIVCLTDTGKRRQQDSRGFENAVNGSECGTNIVNQLQRLCEYDAVKCIRRNLRC